MKNIVITKKMIIDFAIDYGYNIDLFNKYLVYQEECAEKYQGKWTIEEYALSKILEENLDIKDICIGSFHFKEQYAIWMGFGSAYNIPDYVCFEKYCSLRDLYHLHSNVKTKKIKDQIRQ